MEYVYLSIVGVIVIIILSCIIKTLRGKLAFLKINIEEYEEKKEELKNYLDYQSEQYNSLSSENFSLKKEIDKKEEQLSNLSNHIKNFQEAIELQKEKTIESERKLEQAELEKIKVHYASQRDLIENDLNEIQKSYNDEKSRYESLLEPIKNIQKENNLLLYKTIQLSEEDKKDIDFLIHEVSNKIRNKDLINKLIWSEYIQQKLDRTLKDNNITEVSGIYKITNINNKKCYIGKSTNIKRRIIEHVKGALQISSISSQYIHDAMREEGLWNFTFEKLHDCAKDDLSKEEKYYIEFFDSTNYGYNISKGG